MSVEQYSLIAHDWLNLEFIINDLTSRVIGQELSPTSEPTFAGLTVTGNSVLGLNSAVFQPTTDSTTFFQVLDADGGTPIFNVDTTNERVGVGTIPEVDFHIKNSGGSVQLLLQSLATSDATIRLRNGSSSKWTFGNDASNDEFIISTGSILGTPKLTILQDGKTGIGTGANAPNAPLEVKGVKPGVVGGWQSGQLQVTGDGTEFYCAVITGHNAFNGNTQLWYLGSTSSSSHNDIAFINRQNAPIHFYTNNTSRMTISAAGNVDILTGNLDVAGGITSAGIIQATDFAKTGWPVTPGVMLSFVGGTTRTFTVTDGGSAYYYIDGVKYTLGENKTVVIDDLEGLWYIYFDGAALTASQTIWSFLDENKVLVGYLYWARDVGTPANGKAIFVGYELHSFHMSGATHARLHYAGGARWETGLLVADAGSETVNVSAGDIWDEDLNLPITDEGGGLFSQVLSPAQLPIYYRDGATNWRIYETNEKAIATDAGYVDISDDLKYNKLNGTWANATVGLNNYVAYWVVATNEQTEPVVLIMGQRFDNKLSEAKENNIFGGLSLTGLPFEEMVVLARLILKDTGSGVFYTLEEVLDLRALNIGGNITSPLITQHAGLGGLNWANAGHTFDTAVDFNAQNISNIGTVGCGVITQSGATLAATYQPLDDVLTDLAALAVVADNEFIVGTGAGTYAHESGATARTSLGVGTGDSPTFANVSLGTGELTCGSINRASGTLTHEIGGVTVISTTSTATTFSGNIKAVMGVFGYTALSAGVELEAVDGGTDSQATIQTTTYNDQAAWPSVLRFLKSNTDTKGVLSETQDGDALGTFNADGVASGGTTRGACKIRFTQDGAAAAIKVPGKIQFQTSDGTNAPTTVLLITADQKVRIGSTDAPTSVLDVTGDANVTDNYKVDGTRVATNRQAAIANATDAATTMARLNDLLATCRTHGLIAT